MSKEHPSEIANRFQVQSILGEGGIGFVYKAFDPVLAKSVAIKTLKQGMPAQSIVRFQQEAVAIGKLKHQNIIDVFDFGMDEDTPYLVMELLQGSALSQYMKTEEWNNLSLLELLDIFGQTCDGIAHAHRTGILHRDIKPSNIMLLESEDKKKQVKLVDFGLAKLEEDNQSITSTGAAIGSPLYMSPEQVAGEELNFKTDIYSFGCVMYYSICGQPPFRGESAAETMLMHKKSAIPEIKDTFNAESVPKQLLMLIRSCLQKEKSDRPSSFEVVQRILSDISLELTETDPPLSPNSKQQEFFSLKALPKISLAWKLSFTLAALLTLFAGFYFFQQSNEQENKEREKYPAIKNAFSSAPIPKSTSPLSDSVDTHFTPKLVKHPRNDFLEGNRMVDDEFLLTLNDKKLEKLSLRNTIVKGSAFASLKNKKIVYLDLAHTRIGNAALKDITKIQSLSYLGLEGCDKLNNRSYSHLTDLKVLETIVLKSKKVNDETMEFLSQIPTLRAIRIEGPSHLTDEGFNYLLKLKDLRSLNISGTKVTYKSLKKLNKFKKLESLGISNLDLNDEILAEITKKLPELKSLVMIGNYDLSPQGYSYLKRLKKLEFLDISHSSLNDKGLKHIPQKALKVLSVDSSKITGDSINFISKIKGISKLEISGLNLTDQDVLCLKDMKNLEELHVQYNRLSDKSLEVFAKIKSLRAIVLKGMNTSIKANKSNNVKITVKGLKKFVKECPNCEILN